MATLTSDGVLQGTLLASSVVGFPRRRAYSAMRAPGACIEIAEQPLGAPSNISARMGRDERIHYSTIGVSSSPSSPKPSSGKLLRYGPTRASSEDGGAPCSRQ
jgi:hypothetical protein